MSQQQNNEVVMSQSRILTKVVGSNKYICNVCGEEMPPMRAFSDMACKNGHALGKTTDDGMLINVTVHEKE